ncbi:hypothetical protein [Peredibacter starrii]|uniref:Uncharacterized protein n=1 Tax=Peredibacter starrii TaxID=28202 RepID=A0AAX4HM68_9BACT|nr:hypothetical protein [Peredibacter starrii]WPU64392.1 hypothetical protein SOO65_16995 [Peredibacter starrii]
MQASSKKDKRNPLSKGQNRLLQESLKKLLGYGLLEDHNPKSSNEEKSLKLRVILDSGAFNN